MNCKRIVELLPAYHSHELKGWVIMEIQLHLRACESCRREEKELSAAWNLLGVLKPIEPSPHFRERFWARLRQEQEKNERRWDWLNAIRLGPAMAATMASVMIGVMSGYVVFQTHFNRQGFTTAESMALFVSPHGTSAFVDTTGDGTFGTSHGR